MNGRWIIVAFAMAAMTVFPGEPRAQEGGGGQNVVIGAGFGSHAFTPSHHTETVAGNFNVSAALMTQAYAEWYVFSTLGFGLRFVSFGAGQTSSGSVTVGSTTASASNNVDVAVSNFLATVNWIPLGAEGYARLGVLAGLGVSEYSLTASSTGLPSDSVKLSGTAVLAGAYVDWGGDEFGARFGIQQLTTNLGESGGKKVDASGREFYLDLRWAF